MPLLLHPLQESPQIPTLRNSIRALGFAVALTGAAWIPGCRETKTEVHESLRAFNPEAYTPPEAGVIIERMIKLEAKKTIILLPDMHSDSSFEGAVNRQGQVVQSELFAILVDAIQRYRSVTLVQENWFNGLTTDMVLKPQDGSVDSGIPHLDIIRSIAAERSESRRLELAKDAVAKYPVPASLFVLATYPDRFRLVGPSSANDILDAQALINRAFQIDEIMRHTERVPCSDFGGATGLSLDQTFRRFGTEKSNPRVVDCYCRYKSVYDETTEMLRVQRTETAPQQEISTALKSDSSVVWVIAGMNHLKRSREILDAEPVNRFVVSPRSLERQSREGLDEVFVIPKLPDPHGSCDRWRLEQDNKVFEQFSKSMQEE